ncbi:1-acyl-sn-glycerol-3-phosphate acyltransferase [Undibacterium sp. TJN25]|uniref:1-acyl-sn-glycerol-3-phosphate acyltransferase n=1 Tax=Undibacterium sp. TJN25 TaxID=3413056 RepID=UPI003BF252FC
MTAFLLREQELPTRLQRWSLRILKLLGWQVRYRPVPGPRGIVIVYPHTSNWDVPVGVLAKWAIGFRFRFIAKASLFQGMTGATVGRLLRGLGGEPVERGVSTGSIARLAEKINAADSFWLAITPEGTRGYQPYWRSGFYHIALAAGIPVGCARFDYGKKEIALVDYLTLSGNQAEDMEKIRMLYAGTLGLRPAYASEIVLRPDENVRRQD